MDGYFLKDKECHEIAFYYLMKSRGTRELNSSSKTHGVEEKMYWIPMGGQYYGVYRKIN